MAEKIIKECNFNGTNGECNICPEVVLTSPALYKEHIQGKKHLKKKAKLENEGITVLSCLNTGDDCTLSHLEHTLNDETITPEDIKLYDIRGITLVSDGTGKCRECNIEFTSLKYARKHYQSASCTPEQNIYSKGITMDGNSGFCKVCNITLTSPSHARQHGEGNNHKKKLRKIETQEEDEHPEYYISGKIIYDRNRCHVCGVTFTAKSNKDSHIAGYQHVKVMDALAKFESSETSPPSYASLADSS